MSERAAAAGTETPSYELVHKGRTYKISPALTDKVMLELEVKQYNRACRALYEQKELMPESEYFRRLEVLSKRYETGEFAFESEQTMNALKTQKGALLLLECLVDCSNAELMTLFMERGAELQSILKTVLALSFPKPKDDSPKGRAPHKRGR